MLFSPVTTLAQRANEAYVDYINRYRDIALQHQAQYGIPAGITLAQGLLESRAGKSYLATQGNNHFGIKCHNNWHGEAVQYDDTLRHACYRKYATAEDSFLDHARFLLGKRYSRLYLLDINDYRGWAHGLRECGYAEDPNYPKKLIAIIEQYRLSELSGKAEQADTTATPDKADEADKSDKAATADRPEQKEKSGQSDRPQRPAKRINVPDRPGAASPDND